MTTFFSNTETMMTIFWQAGDYDSSLVPLTPRISSETLSHGLYISVDTPNLLSIHPKWRFITGRISFLNCLQSHSWVRCHTATVLCIISILRDPWSKLDMFPFGWLLQLECGWPCSWHRNSGNVHHAFVQSVFSWYTCRAHPGFIGIWSMEPYKYASLFDKVAQTLSSQKGSANCSWRSNI